VNLVLLPRRGAVSESSEDFAALLARARRNDPDAQAELVRRYESKVRLVARVLLGTALRPYLDSLDLMQSVHRSLLLALRDSKFAISSPEQLVGLATTMVRRKVARQWRRMRRQQRTASDDAPTLLTSLVSSEVDPARAAQSNDAIRRLWDNLDGPEQRLVRLRLDGYSTAEIASELGLSPVALRVRMTRLRQRLQSAGVFDDWL
jgi:RNA polymerase sigma factor (sigma-70 family)